MINIIEAKPTKLSGTSSLYISFPFNREIVDTIKTCNKYMYDSKTYTWELPVTDLSYLLDELTYIDDIKLKVIGDEGTTFKLNQAEILDPKISNWLKELDKKLN